MKGRLDRQREIINLKLDNKMKIMIWELDARWEVIVAMAKLF